MKKIWTRIFICLNLLSGKYYNKLPRSCWDLPPLECWFGQIDLVDYSFHNLFKQGFGRNLGAPGKSSVGSAEKWQQPTAAEAGVSAPGFPCIFNFKKLVYGECFCQQVQKHTFQSTLHVLKHTKYLSIK